MKAMLRVNLMIEEDSFAASVLDLEQDDVYKP